MSNKIYYVQRHEFDDYDDEFGTVSFQSAHATLESANNEARDLLHYLFDEDYSEKGVLQDDEEEVVDRTYKGVIRSRSQDPEAIDLCVITVEETHLHAGLVYPHGQRPSTAESKKRQRTDDVVKKEDEPDEKGVDKGSQKAANGRRG
jgi:hypothetical protein